MERQKRLPTWRGARTGRRIVGRIADPLASADAHTAAACATVSCVAAQENQLATLLTPFLTLPGTASFAGNQQIEGRIYQTRPTPNVSRRRRTPSWRMRLP